MNELESALEAILFTMGQSVEIRQLMVALDLTREQVENLVFSLREKYEKRRSGLTIIGLGESYQMCTKREYYSYLIKVAKTPKKQVLTDAVLETLSIIAYKQPITRAEIEHIRGVSSDYMVNKLVEYGLVFEVGKLDAPGRPAQFATTEEFLRRFGIESNSALPVIDMDTEAEIMHEVEKEVGYKFDKREEDDEN